MPRTISSPPRLFTIRELARESGVPVPSIKYYLREGLLPAGDPDNPGRAYYSERHLRRLSVIRALRDVGGLSIDTLRRALAAVDAPGADAVDAIAPAIDALAPSRGAPPRDAHLRRARADVDAFLDAEGIVIRPEAGARETLARALAAMRRTGAEVGLSELGTYLPALRVVARAEVESESTRRMMEGDKEGALELAVLGTVLYEPVILALRRALHEHFTTELLRGRARRRRR